MIVHYSWVLVRVKCVLQEYKPVHVHKKYVNVVLTCILLVWSGASRSMNVCLQKWCIRDIFTVSWIINCGVVCVIMVVIVPPIIIWHGVIIHHFYFLILFLSPDQLPKYRLVGRHVGLTTSSDVRCRDMLTGMLGVSWNLLSLYLNHGSRISFMDVWEVYVMCLLVCTQRSICCLTRHCFSCRRNQNQF